jgi:potassium-transporting ATPase potassium-binding subunit
MVGSPAPDGAISLRLMRTKVGSAVLDDAGEPVTRSEQVTQQTIPLGPAASQIAVKQLGTNGGGFFNVNSAHPLENPTPLSNLNLGSTAIDLAA